MRKMSVAAAAFALLAACDSNMVTTDATVVTIDRTCKFELKGESKTEILEDDCKSSDEWASVRADKKKQNIVGNGVVTVTFTNPKDASSQTGTFKIRAPEDRFFSLNADDVIKIKVNPDNPAKIRPL